MIKGLSWVVITGMGKVCWMERGCLWLQELHECDMYGRLPKRRSSYVRPHLHHLRSRSFSCPRMFTDLHG